MKKIILLLVVVIVYSYNYAQPLQVGDKVPDIVLENVLLPAMPDIVAKNVQLSSFKNKIILLDFWATWCGSCIVTFPKYESLQKKYKDKLQIIMVTHEQISRVQRFLKNRPMQLNVAVDTTESFRKYFEYRSIPHVILIDRQGIVKAITHTDEIKEKIIEDTWAGNYISLPLKKDFMEFSFKVDYFNADSTINTSFNLQPAMEGFPAYYKFGEGVFKNRRISMINHTIDAMYRVAYKVTYERTVYEVDKSEFDTKKGGNKYCLDVIVPKEAENNLYKTIQDKLPELFDANVKLEKRKISVHVLKKNTEIITFKKSNELNDFYSGKSNEFTGNGLKITALAEYLEKFGLLGTPVVDETGIEGRYDIHLEWESGKKGAVKEAFLKAGFVLEKTEREIEVLVFYR